MSSLVANDNFLMHVSYLSLVVILSHRNPLDHSATSVVLDFLLVPFWPSLRSLPCLLDVQVAFSSVGADV